MTPHGASEIPEKILTKAEAYDAIVAFTSEITLHVKDEPEGEDETD